MSFLPIAEGFAAGHFKNARLIATDMDGTLTHRGHFSATLLQTLEALAKADFPVIVVTGRSAGWVNAIANYLPVAGAIAENGGLYYSCQNEAPELLTSICNLDLHRQQLSETFQRLKRQLPHLKETTDNRFRLTDWTFDIEGLTAAQLQQLETLCQEQDWGFTYSTVQCHIKPLHQDKATSLLRVLQQHFPQFPPAEVITVGDSPNDESLFDPKKFPLSVGVANVLHYSNQLNHKPAYVTNNPEAEGFCELTRLVMGV